MSGFNNSIVGGQGTLIRESIHSPDYVPGVSGWSINKDGSAEFQDLTITGGSIVVDSDTSTILVYDGPAASGNLICSMASEAGTDPYGNTYPQGFGVSVGAIDGSIINPGTIGTAQVDFTAREIGGVTTTLSGTQPSDPTIGDLWIDSASGNVVKRWSGTAWTVAAVGTDAIQTGAVTAGKLEALLVLATVIQSQDYVSGVSGWQINGTGSAEFNDITFRGTLISEDPVTGQSVEITAGEIVLDAATVNATMHADPSIGLEIFVNNEGITLQAPNGPIILDGTEIDLQDDTACAAGLFMYGTNPVMYAGPWTNLTLASGMSAQAGAYRPAYRFVSDNTIELRGGISGTIPSTTTLFTAPAPIRPASTVRFPVAATSNTAIVGARIDMTSAGTTAFNCAGGGSASFVSLDGISYDLT